MSKLWEILDTPLAEVKLLHLFVGILLVVGLFLVVKRVWKFLTAGADTTTKGFKKLFTFKKRKMANTICPRCGRTLEHCTCAGNKGISLKKRYKKHKAEKKLQQLQSK